MSNLISRESTRFFIQYFFPNVGIKATHYCYYLHRIFPSSRMPIETKANDIVTRQWTKFKRHVENGFTNTIITMRRRNRGIYMYWWQRKTISVNSMQTEKDCVRRQMNESSAHATRLNSIEFVCIQFSDFAECECQMQWPEWVLRASIDV